MTSSAIRLGVTVRPVNESFDEGSQRKKDLTHMDAIDMKTMSMKAGRNGIELRDAYLSRLEASQLIGISPIKFDQLMKWPSFPWPIWIEGKIPQWNRSDLECWIDWQRQEPRERFAYESIGMNVDSRNSKEAIK